MKTWFWLMLTVILAGSAAYIAMGKAGLSGGVLNTIILVATAFWMCIRLDEIEERIK